MSVFYERLAPWYDAYVLDVACGTGRHLVHLREHAAEVAGSDVSSAMLAVAGDRLPGVPLHEADFRELALGRTFDVVTCLFSSIGHVADADDLDRAIAAMAAHVAPGGALVVEPWLTPEVFVEAAGLAATWVEHDSFPRGLVLGRRGRR